jgi:N-acyl-D-amino-acid deacylase
MSKIGPALAVAAAIVSFPVGAMTQEHHDLVIRNGRVFDGLGNPWVYADVVIKNGRIAQVGRIQDRGLREIDASGCYVSPGCIDLMDQWDLAEPTLVESLQPDWRIAPV